MAGTKPGHDGQRGLDFNLPSSPGLQSLRMHTEGANAVYIMASRKHGTLYIGVTSNLIQRVGEHRDGLRPGFTTTYGVKRLVWYEQFDGIVEAIQREKSLKKYRRDWKINLIEEANPSWEDLYESLFAEPRGPLTP